MICESCGSPLKDGAKFCAKCGNPAKRQDIPAPRTATRPSGIATKTSGASVSSTASSEHDAAPHVPTSPATSASVAAPVVASDPLAEETEEVASWRWNWGAFLIPGIWLLAHRIKTHIVFLVLLGVPIIGVMFFAVTNIVGAIRAENADAQGITQGYVNTPDQLWSDATMYTGWLLALYIVACLFSITVARNGSLDAWRNFPHQRLAAFRTAQRIWAVGGIAVMGTLIWANVTAQNGYARVMHANEMQRHRFSAVTYKPWVYQNSSGNNRVVYRFFESYFSRDANCEVQINGGKPIAASYGFAHSKLSLISTNTQVGNHTYTLSEDAQSLVEIGGDGKTLHPAP